MTNFRIIASIILVMLPSIATADTGKFCTYLFITSFTSESEEEYAKEEYSLQDCEKGDVIVIVISDDAYRELDRVAMYMAGEIAEICDNTLPVTIVSEDRAVCTYRGSRRSIRGPKREAEDE